MTEDSKGYMENYKILQNTAEKIQAMTVPDVDAIVPLVQNATDAWKSCKDRIEKVEQLLGLGNEEKQ